MMKRICKKNGSNKGFSLVELLIVVGIIAIIVAIVATGLLRYIEKSKIRKDVSNGTAILDAAVTAINEPDAYREYMATTTVGSSTSYSLSPGKTNIAFGFHPLFEKSFAQYMPNVSDFEYRKNSPVAWNVNIIRKGEKEIDVTVTVTTSAGEIKLAPEAQDPYF